jgi:hypothetical protein
MNLLTSLVEPGTTAAASGATSIWSGVTKSFSETMTGLGVLAAGIYFGWRLYRGYFVQNLSLDLQLKRCAADPELDYLDITTKVTKGDRNTTKFEDMEVRVWWPGFRLVSRRSKPYVVTSLGIPTKQRRSTTGSVLSKSSGMSNIPSHPF